MRRALAHIVVLLAAVRRSTASLANSCSAITPPPENQICGQNGHFDPAEQFSTQVTSADQCRDFLFNANEGFSGYDSATNTCMLYFGALRTTKAPSGRDGVFTPDPNSTTTFTSIKCYMCTKKCNLPSTKNLLYNPGFNISENLLGPWGVVLNFGYNGTTETAAIAPSKRPGNAVQLFVFRNAGIFQKVFLCAKQDYIASFDYLLIKPPNFNSSNFLVSITMSIGDCEAKLMHNGTTVKFGRWGTLACSTQHLAPPATFGTDKTFSIVLDIPNEDTPIYISNPQLRQIPPPQTLKTTGKSLLVNGGFETGSLEPWVASSFPNPSPKVDMPGMRPIDGLPASKHKFVFISGGVYDAYYGNYINSLELSQTTSQPLERGKLYVFTMEYRQIATTGFELDIVDTTFFRDNNVLNYAGTTIRDNKTMVLSRIFTGSGEPSEALVRYRNGIFVSHLHTKIELDNISIRKLANQDI